VWEVKFVTAKDDIKKLLEETNARIRDPKTSGTECNLIIMDFADKMTAMLPKLFQEYERLEKDLASVRSYCRWLDKQYHTAYENARKTLR
jgi:hypothetical protein